MQIVTQATLFKCSRMPPGDELSWHIAVENEGTKPGVVEG